MSISFHSSLPKQIWFWLSWYLEQLPSHGSAVAQNSEESTPWKSSSFTTNWNQQHLDIIWFSVVFQDTFVSSRLSQSTGSQSRHAIKKIYIYIFFLKSFCTTNGCKNLQTGPTSHHCLPNRPAGCVARGAVPLLAEETTYAQPAAVELKNWNKRADRRGKPPENDQNCWQTGAPLDDLLKSRSQVVVLLWFEVWKKLLTL